MLWFSIRYEGVSPNNKKREVFTMGLFNKKKTYTMKCPNCEEKWQIAKTTWQLTPYGQRGITPSFICPKCRCVGRRTKD